MAASTGERESSRADSLGSQAQPRGLHSDPRVAGFEPRIGTCAGVSRKWRRARGDATVAAERSRESAALTRSPRCSVAGASGSPDATLLRNTPPAPIDGALADCGLAGSRVLWEQRCRLPRSTPPAPSCPPRRRPPGTPPWRRRGRPTPRTQGRACPERPSPGRPSARPAAPAKHPPRPDPGGLSRSRPSSQAATLKSRRPTATPRCRPTSRPCRAGNATSGAASTRSSCAPSPACARP